MAHLEENSLITQADLVYTKLEPDPSVSYLYKYVLAVTDDWQAPQSVSGIFANAQNILITGGTFIVSF